MKVPHLFLISIVSVLGYFVAFSSAQLVDESQQHDEVENVITRSLFIPKDPRKPTGGGLRNKSKMLSYMKHGMDEISSIESSKSRELSRRRRRRRRRYRKYYGRGRGYGCCGGYGRYRKYGYGRYGGGYYGYGRRGGGYYGYGRRGGGYYGW